jgi:site-specific DNA-methyltransferase (adenine-specific)
MPTVGKKKKPVGKKKTGKKVGSDHDAVHFDDGSVYADDAIHLLQTLPDESVDLAIFDPAYESLEKWRKMGTTTRLKESKGSSNKWFETFPNSRYPELFMELYRVMKKGTFIYMFCDEETRDVVTTGLAPGFKLWKSLVWDKVHKGMGYHFPAQHEFIVMAEKLLRKGKHRRLNENKTGDVISCARLKGKAFYPTEKPKPLMWKLITESTDEGDTVLDFFCGSGVVGEAARLCGRKFILGDIDPAEAIKRLS